MAPDTIQLWIGERQVLRYTVIPWRMGERVEVEIPTDIRQQLATTNERCHIDLVDSEVELTRLRQEQPRLPWLQAWLRRRAGL